MSKNDIDAFRKEFGFPARSELEPSGPEAPDQDELRAYVAGEVDLEREEVIRFCITRYRDWADAYGQIVKERLDLHSIDSKRPRFVSLRQLTSRRAIVGYAAVASIIIAAFLWLRPRSVTINDGVAMITINRSGQIEGLEQLPQASRDDVRNLLANNEFPTPSVFETIRNQIPDRSGLSPPRNVLLTPVSTAVITSKPTFKWRTLPEAVNYTIIIRDSSSNALKPYVLSSSNSAITEWTIPDPLQPATAYTWTVEAKLSDGTIVAQPAEGKGTAKFYVLSVDEKTEVQSRIDNAANSHLTRLVIYTEAGLLDHAEIELQHLINQNGRSELLNQIKTVLDKLRQQGP